MPRNEIRLRGFSFNPNSINCGHLWCNGIWNMARSQEQITIYLRVLYIEHSAYDHRNGIYSLPNNIFDFLFFVIISSKSHIFLIDIISSTSSCALLFISFHFSWIKSLVAAAAAGCRQNFGEKKTKQRREKNRQGKEARAVEIHQKLVSPVHVVISHTDIAQTAQTSSSVVTAVDGDCNFGAKIVDWDANVQRVCVHSIL